MHAPNLLLGALFATLTITTAAPPPASFVNKTDTHDDIRDCVVPEIALITRFSPFKLRVRVRGALTPFAFTEPGPSSLEEDQPFLSRYVETQSVFRLTDGNLTTADRGFDNFQAFFGSTPEVGQPFLNPLLFSRNGGETRFFGVYSCDESGKYILVLRTDKTLVVRALEPGAEIFGQQGESKDPAIEIELEIVNVDDSSQPKTEK